MVESEFYLTFICSSLFYDSALLFTGRQFGPKETGSEFCSNKCNTFEISIKQLLEFLEISIGLLCHEEI